MGRDYWGDIEGRFWFGVQSSDAADRFGVEGYSPNELKYSFDKSDLPGVENGIKEIEEGLGTQLDVIVKFFEDHPDGYNNQMIGDLFTDTQLSEYADLLLGRQIRDYLKENDTCEFTAEY